MKKFFKRMFCKHDYVYESSEAKTFHEDDFCGDGCFNTWTEHYDVYVCTKCGKRKWVLK